MTFEMEVQHPASLKAQGVLIKKKNAAFSSMLFSFALLVVVVEGGFKTAQQCFFSPPPYYFVFFSVSVTWLFRPRVFIVNRVQCHTSFF